MEQHRVAPLYGEQHAGNPATTEVGANLEEPIERQAGMRLLRYSRNDANKGCHCEERSDEAILGVGGFACRAAVQQRGAP